MNAVVKTDETMERWNALLESIASGLPIEKAMLQCRVTRADIELAVLAPMEAERWALAQSQAVRKRWSTFDIDEVFARVSRGASLMDAVIQVRGSDLSGELLYLIDSDKSVAEGYARAKRALTHVMEQEVLDIVDDDSRDVLSGPKGDIPNSASVLRSKTRAEFRWKVMGVWNPIYSEKKADTNIQVNIQHAETLEHARERAKLRGNGPVRITRDQMQRAVDATVSEVVATPEPDLYGFDE